MYNSKITAHISTGIWIDRKHALIVNLNEKNEELLTVDSEIEMRNRIEGEGKESTRMGEQYISNENTKEEKLKHELRQYFQNVADKLHETKKLYICGPAETRNEFSKFLDQFNSRPFKILRNETCGSLTQNQLKAKVRDFFKEA